MSVTSLSGRDLALLAAGGPAALTGALRDGFRLWLEGRDFAVSTQSTYYKRARGYLKWLVAEGKHPDALSAGPARDIAVAEYLADTRPSTRNVTLAAIRVLYEWLDLGPVSVDAAVVAQVVPDTLDERQQSGVLNAAAARSARDYALITLFLDVGPRPSELRRLNVDDLDLSARAGEVRLTSSEGFVRTVELSQATTWVLMGWQRERRTMLGARSRERALFLTLSSHNRIKDDESLGYIVAGVGETAGLERKLTPSRLRATVEKRLLEAGLDPAVVAAQMGQTYINTPRVRALLGTQPHRNEPVQLGLDIIT